MQACAEQVLGRKAVQFPDLYANKEYLKGMFSNLFGPTRQVYHWEHSKGYKQWWIDALTVEPTKLLHGMTGLWEHGIEQPVCVTDLENASIGTLPTVSVYIAVHAEHGTHAFYPHFGAKGGGKNRDAEGKVYDGFKYWHSDLPLETLQEIAALKYCNHPKAVQAFEAHATEEQKLAFHHVPTTREEFNPDYFMVCPTYLPHATTRKSFITSCTTLSYGPVISSLLATQVLVLVPMGLYWTPSV